MEGQKSFVLLSRVRDRISVPNSLFFYGNDYHRDPDSDASNWNAKLVACQPNTGTFVSRKGIGIVIQPPYRRNPPVRNVAARVLLFPRSNCHLFYLLITVQSLLEIEHVHFYQLDSHYPTQHYPIYIVRIKMYLSEIRNVRNGEKDGGNSVNQCQSTDTWRAHH